MIADAEPRYGRNPLRWPAYDAKGALRWHLASIDEQRFIACEWDFSTYGGTVGEADADTFIEAVRAAMAATLPLVTFVRSGGTRLQEGLAALVGIPRCVLALDELAARTLPHISVALHPTTGGVWVGVCSVADLRIGIAGATIGFAGPRVVEAMTGAPLPEGSHTAESAFAAGLLDAVVTEDELDAQLLRSLRATAPTDAQRAGRAPMHTPLPERDAWAQVEEARSGARPHGAELLTNVLEQSVELHARDDTVAGAVGRIDGRRLVAVAIAARRDGRPTVTGYRLLQRAAMVAGRLRVPLVTFVDTPGADPREVSERAGIAQEIAAAMRAVLHCPSPTLAVVHGEGGSGGALAAATCDAVLMTETSYFTALGPEGAAAALKTTPHEAAARMGVTPGELFRLGFTDAVIGADPGAITSAVASWLHTLTTRGDRLERRRARWSTKLPHAL